MRTLCTALLGTLAMTSIAQAAPVQAGDYLVTDDERQAVIGVDRTTGTQYIVSSGGDFVTPYGIAVTGDGRIFVTDPAAFGGIGAIFEINPVTGAQTTIITGSGRFLEPYGIAIEANGSLITADSREVGRVDPTAGSPAYSPVSLDDHFLSATGITTGPTGTIYVADYQTSTVNDGKILSVDPVSGIQTLLSDYVTYPLLRDTNGIAFSGGELFVTDLSLDNSDRILRIDLTTGAPSILNSADFNGLSLLGVDNDGALLVADRDLDAVFRVDTTTGFATMISNGQFFLNTHQIVVYGEEVPEPATLLLTGLGVTSAAIRARRGARRA